MAIMALSLVAVQITAQGDRVVQPRRILMADALAIYGRRAVDIYEQGGDPALQSYLAGIEKKTRVKAYLFEPTGSQCGDATGSWLAPPDVRDLVVKTHNLSVEYGGLITPQFTLSQARVMAAQPVITERGTYVFAGAMSRTLLAATVDEPETQMLRVISVFLITGIFCYGLARYLAAPVGKIRSAAQKIAMGDLSARVEPNRFPRGHDELTSLARDFDAMAERMESLVTAQSRLLGDVSHELRSPLTRLGLALELARRGDDVKRTAAFERIEREATRLDALIGELLTLSRLENGLRGEELNHIVDLTAVARDVAADADFEAHNAGRGVRVTFEGPDESIVIKGDPELLRRAFENVARNAARHTYENTTVDITLQVIKDRVIWTARDHGPGVPEEDLSNIFRPFYRVEDARERAEFDRGTGLGLAIAERAATAHRGIIKARNAQDGGLEVEISLPTVK